MIRKSAPSFSKFFGSLIITSFISTYAFAAPYCLAVRGNGELAPAHWGAIARVIESRGLPTAMAGGSSGSISLFLIESIAQNQYINGAVDVEQKQSASLLVKSLQGYLEVVASHPEWRELQNVVHYLKQTGGNSPEEFLSWLKTMIESHPQELAALVFEHGAEIQQSLQLAVKIGLVNPETFRPLLALLKDFTPAGTAAMTAAERMQKIAQIQFFAGEIYQSVALLGAFNAESDQNLFFRPGIINFTALAESFGRVGNFYSGRGMSPAQNLSFRKFMQRCGPLAADKTWDELRRGDVSCDNEFKSILIDYQQTAVPTMIRGRQLDRVGAWISAFPSTAVLTGKAYDLANAALKQYPLSLDHEFGRSFSVDAADVSFGYWGHTSDLRRVERNLKIPFRDSKGTTLDFTNDEKSRRFLSLGEATWADVMSVSPAEPGLAPFQKISSPAGPAYSAGGWSDLHPAAVLKAAGCDDIIYVTRRGGESLFGQGVAKRLLGFPEVPWSRLATDAAHKDANIIRNNNGDTADMTSIWSRLYNLANPESSINRALDMFSTVVCSDWNRFDIKTPGAVGEMIDDAYHAPWLHPGAESKKVNTIDPARGYRPFAGCLSFARLK